MASPKAASSSNPHHLSSPLTVPTSCLSLQHSGHTVPLAQLKTAALGHISLGYGVISCCLRGYIVDRWVRGLSPTVYGVI